MKNKLKIHRAMNDMTQSDIAKEVGVSRQTIHAIESGNYNPSAQLALKLAQIFKTKVEELFVLEDKDWKD